MNPVSLSKKYKCKICKSPYVKRNPWQSLCGSVDCAVAVANKAKAKRERIERAATKQKIQDLATKPELTKLAQKSFNDYIRARDYGKPCICCGKPIAWSDKKSTGGVCDAGHYLSIGARVNLRFNEDNCHAQRKYCNNQLSGNAVNYRIGLIARIGIERVEALESDHELKHWNKDQLREIAAIYKAKLKALTKE